MFLGLITKPNLVILTASHNDWFLCKHYLVGKPNQNTQTNPKHLTTTKTPKNQTNKQNTNKKFKQEQTLLYSVFFSFKGKKGM